MSPILALAPFFSGVLCLIAWSIFRRCARRFDWSRNARRIVFAGIVLFFPIGCTGICIWLPEAARREASDVTSAEANDFLVFQKVPVEASHVTCLHDYFSGLTEAAEFTIGENAFLAWAKRRNWSPKWFDGSERVPTVGLLASGRWADGRPSIDRGYYVNEREGDSGVVVLYDADARRCYLEFTTF